MSNKENDNFNETIKELIEEYWTIEDRPDLFEDCTNYVFTNLDQVGSQVKGDTYLGDSICFLMLQYFQSISHNAISNQDLNNMENQYYNEWPENAFNLLNKV